MFTAITASVQPDRRMSHDVSTSFVETKATAVAASELFIARGEAASAARFWSDTQLGATLKWKAFGRGEKRRVRATVKSGVG